MSLRCLCGWHNWGKQYNVRKASMGLGALFVPILFLSHYGMFQECDRKCVRCGKVQTFDYDDEIGT